MASPTRSLLRHPDFLKLWTAATVSLFGTQVSQIAIPFIATVLLAASPGEVGLLTTIEFLPFLLFTLPAGVWVDRLPRRRILVAADIGRGVLLLSIPLAWWADALTIWQLYAVGFLMGTMTVFFDVADQSFLPTVLDRDQLVDGNAKLQTSTSAAQILGQPLGGGIVGLLTAPVAVLVDAVSYAGSALLIFAIRRRERFVGRSTATAAAEEAGETSMPAAGGVSVMVEAAAEDAGEPAARPAAPTRAGMRKEMGEGLTYILRHKYLANIAATTATSNLFTNIAFAIFPVYVYRLLELTPQAVGGIGGIAGAGVLIGALIAVRVAKQFGVGPVIVGTAFLFGPVNLLIAAAPKEYAFLFIAAAMFLGSILNVVYNVNQVSLRQAITPESFQGRMNATMRFLVWGTIPIGSLIGAGLSEVIGVHETVWVGAILNVFTFLPVLLSPVRRLQEIPTEEPEAA